MFVGTGIAPPVVVDSVVVSSVDIPGAVTPGCAYTSVITTTDSSNTAMTKPAMIPQLVPNPFAIFVIILFCHHEFCCIYDYCSVIQWSEYCNIPPRASAVSDNDVMHGEAGNESLFGGPDDDNMAGGPGDDIFFGEAGTDSADGGPDIDICNDTENEVNCEA